jgi:telomere length regulation protein
MRWLHVALAKLHREFVPFYCWNSMSHPSCRSIIEEFFKNQYSTNQRFVMLNALALGARELTSVPSPSVLKPVLDRMSFPSRLLPPHLHQKYLGSSTQRLNPVSLMLDSISREAIGRHKDAIVEKVPEVIRERRLQIRKPTKVTEVKPLPTNVALQLPTMRVTFPIVAAEFFLAPLINHFWLFLRDEQTREERTAHRDALHRYRGAGTGLILSAMVLAHFLGTLAVLVHASQNAPEWLAVIAPDALELAVTVGTRPLSQGEVDEDDEGRSPDGLAGETRGKEATVLTTALELALVILDGCLQLDGGRSLGLDHTALLMGAGEWAGHVFARLEKGALLSGGGGEQALKLKRAAAGVLLKVDELTSRWRRSMVDVR